MVVNSTSVLSVLFFFFLFGSSLICRTEQKDDTSYKLWQKTIWETSPEPGAKKLQLIDYFPKEDQEREFFLKNPVSLFRDIWDKTYVSDGGGHGLMVYDKTGCPIKKIARSGQGPGDLSNPGTVRCHHNEIIVIDRGNQRFSFFEMSGRFRRCFRYFKKYYDFDVDRKGNLYVSKMILGGENKLVDVLNEGGGILYSFGEILPGDKNRFEMNLIKIAIGRNDDVYVAFRHKPLVRKYSSSGRLIAQYNIADRMIDFMKKMNDDSSKKNAKWGQRGLIVITSDIVPSDTGFFLLLCGPSLEILEFDDNGKPRNTFYFNQFMYSGQALGVNHKGIGPLFYVGNSSDGRIDVFKSR
jgi:hypothetical protein